MIENKKLPASVWYQRLLQPEIKLKYCGLRESNMEWITYLERQVSAFTAVFHLTYLRPQSSKVIKRVLSFWKVGNSINTKLTTRLPLLKRVPKQFFRLGSQKNSNDYFLPNLFGTGLIPHTFWLRSVLLTSRAGHCSSSHPTVHSSRVFQSRFSQERTTPLSSARFILHIWKVVKIVYEQIQVKRWGLSGIREQPKSLVLYFWMFSQKSFLNP